MAVCVSNFEYPLQMHRARPSYTGLHSQIECCSTTYPHASGVGNQSLGVGGLGCTASQWPSTLPSTLCSWPTLCQRVVFICTCKTLDMDRLSHLRVTRPVAVALPPCLRVRCPAGFVVGEVLENASPFCGGYVLYMKGKTSTRRQSPRVPLTTQFRWALPTRVRESLFNS